MLLTVGVCWVSYTSDCELLEELFELLVDNLTEEQSLFLHNERQRATMSYLCFWTLSLYVHAYRQLLCAQHTKSSLVLDYSFY